MTVKLALGLWALLATTASSANTSTIIESPKSAMTISLQEFITQAEQDLREKIIVSQSDAYQKIQLPARQDALHYGQLLTLLNINGYTAYKSKGYIHIIPNREARSSAIPIVEKNKFYYDDEYVTDYLKPEKACAFKILGILRPLVPQHGFLMLYGEARTLIIVDTFSNVQRVKSVMKMVDDGLNAQEECTSPGAEFRPI